MDIKADGQHFFSGYSLVKTVCDMEVNYFPFDIQKCSLELSNEFTGSSRVEVRKIIICLVIFVILLLLPSIHEYHTGVPEYAFVYHENVYYVKYIHTTTLLVELQHILCILCSSGPSDSSAKNVWAHGYNKKFKRKNHILLIRILRIR